MRKPLVTALLALVIAGAGAAPTATAAPAAAHAPTAASAPTTASARDTTTTPARDTAPTLHAVDYAGTVALSNCSGSVVRLPASADSDPALVLTNGHCLETGFPEPGEVIVDQASSRSFTLLNSAGSGVATLRASKVAYSTMTDTDVTLYQLTRTYAQIRSSYGISALPSTTAIPSPAPPSRSSPATGSASTPARSTASPTGSRRAAGPGRTPSATPPPATRSAAPRARR